MRVTVGTVVGLIAAGRTRDEILREYPYLEAEDIAEALSYASWRVEEVEVPRFQVRPGPFGRRRQLLLTTDARTRIPIDRLVTFMRRVNSCG